MSIESALKNLVRLHTIKAQINELYDPMNWKQPSELAVLRKEYYSCIDLAWQEARDALAAPVKPDAYAIRNGDGFWCCIYKERGLTELVLSKGLKSNNEVIVALKEIEEKS